jgi:uncharacterized membrane protein
MRLLQVTTLMAATMATGFMAGVFGLYAHTIMPGLGKTDDRTFVGAFQAIDRAVINRPFLATFLGALVLIGVAAALHLQAGRRSVLPWILTALLLYLLVVIITIVVNVPLNDDIKAAGDPDRISDLAAVRDRFNEPRWAAWNIVRLVGSTVAFGCLTWALVLHGQSTEEPGSRNAVLTQIEA